MSLPSIYDPNRVGKVYRAYTTTAITEGMAAGHKPASQDDPRVLVMLVDAQVDFIHPEGSLSVPGAVEDTRRTVEWIYQNVGGITKIMASLDTHIPFQIFYPTWWIDEDGNHPAPYTLISAGEVDQGKWKPTLMEDWSVRYVHQLEEGSKKVLTIWPYHTMLGTEGHIIMPALREAISYHAGARQTQPDLYVKGTIPQTEHYSILEPEVKVPGETLGIVNEDLLKQIASYDRIFVMGQAKSHCVLETVTSMVRYYAEHDPEVIKRVTLFDDGMSSVA
ncbi:MAG: hypothetical protein GYB68_10700, partial [Chloroflexi bacterium]|nr:hypothetical protein [Chloroflexota bacterium]